MGVRGELFSTKILLPNRTYFFNVKENRMGDLYLNIVESKNKESGGFDRQSVILFAEDMQEFMKGFDESLKVMEKAIREKRHSGGKSKRIDKAVPSEKIDDGERKSKRDEDFSSDRRITRAKDRGGERSGERKSGFAGERSRERKSFGGERSGERKSGFAGERSRERKSFGGERSGERKSGFAGERSGERSRERKSSFGGERKGGFREGRSNDRKSSYGDNRGGDRKSTRSSDRGTKNKSDKSSDAKKDRNKRVVVKKRD